MSHPVAASALHAVCLCGGRAAPPASAAPVAQQGRASRASHACLCWTQLHHACLAGQARTAALLLERGADPDAESGGGLDTPLHLACLGGHADVAAALLAWPGGSGGGDGGGAQRRRLRATNKDGWSPLHLAIMSGQRAENQATVCFLLDRQQQQQQQQQQADTTISSAEILDAVNFEGWNAVLLAASRGMDRILEALLRAGARHDLTREKGETALHLAALSGEPECVLVLLQAHASPGARDSEGNLPLHLAAFSGCSESVGLLVRAEPQSTGAPNKVGDTALHVAAGRRHIDAVLELLGEPPAEHLPTAEVSALVVLSSESFLSRALLTSCGVLYRRLRRRRLLRMRPSYWR